MDSSLSGSGPTPARFFAPPDPASTEHLSTALYLGVPIVEKGAVGRLGWILVPLALLLLSSNRAEARTLRLELGAHHLAGGRWIFDAELGLEFPVVSVLSVGGRAGALLATTTPEASFGIPLDFLVRAHFLRLLYLELLVGPWIFVERESIQAHFAIGFGLQTLEMSFGPEVALLGSESMFGMKLAFRL